jgi:hypothetical protein
LKRLLLHLSFFGFFLLISVLPLGAETYELDKLRQAKAQVQVRGDAYQIEVKFLAVKVFTPAKNKTLQQEKAIAYAQRALALHLKCPPQAKLIISGLRLTQQATSGEFSRAVLTVPTKSVSIYPRP